MPILFAVGCNTASLPSPQHGQAIAANAAPHCVAMDFVLNHNRAKGWELTKLSVPQLQAIIDAWQRDDGDNSNGDPTLADTAYIVTHAIGAGDAEVVLIAFAAKGCFLGAWRINPEELHQLLGQPL